MNPHRGETTTQEHLAQEIPINPVIRLLEVQLQQNGWFLCAFKLVDNLLESERTLQDITPTDKRRLVTVDRAVGNRT